MLVNLFQFNLLIANWINLISTLKGSVVRIVFVPIKKTSIETISL